MQNQPPQTRPPFTLLQNKRTLSQYKQSFQALIFQEKGKARGCPTFSTPLDKDEDEELIHQFAELSPCFVTTTERLYRGSHTFTIKFKSQLWEEMNDGSLTQNLFNSKWFWPLGLENLEYVTMGAFESELEWEEVMRRIKQYNKVKEENREFPHMIQEVRQSPKWETFRNSIQEPRKETKSSCAHLRSHVSWWGISVGV